jgi:hypothetical protein
MRSKARRCTHQQTRRPPSSSAGDGNDSAAEEQAAAGSRRADRSMSGVMRTRSIGAPASITLVATDWPCAHGDGRGEVDKTAELFAILDPLDHASTRRRSIDAAEPYVMAPKVYAERPCLLQRLRN